MHADCLVSEGALDDVGSFGWDAAVVGRKFGRGFGEFAKKHDSWGNALSAALIERDVAKNARRALDSGAGLTYALGGDDKLNRQAAECWELDVLLHPEMARDKDFMHQKNSGLDAVTARMMAERGIMLGIVLRDVLSASAGKRVQLMGRIAQNIRLAEKYGVRILYCSGAGDKHGLRAPLDAAALLSLLGAQAAKKAVGENPRLLFQKAADRNDPDLLTMGLRVVSWGETRKPRSKRKYGRV